MNLIVTCARHFEEETREEIENILVELGEDWPKTTIADLPGILIVEIQKDPFPIVERICQKILDEPWSVRYCMRIIPIQKLFTTNLDAITKEILDSIELIKPKGTYRITIEKRNCKIASKQIISEIANKIPNKVCLEDPDWIILIEIIGDKTGIAILEKDLVLSVQRTKRSLSE